MSTENRNIGEIVIRADASVAMGTGHVMRCLALAQAWQDAGGRAVFAMADTTPAVEGRLREESVEIARVAPPRGTREDARQTAALAKEYAAAWVVLDGYQFSSEYQAVLEDAEEKSGRCRVLFLDDNGHCDFYSADLVLNQNIHASSALYTRRSAHTQMLLGLRYVLLRREYDRLRGWQRRIPEVARNLMVTMGGSDPANFSLRILEALPQIGIDGMKVKLVVGGSNPRRAALQECARRIGNCVELLDDVRNMADLMTWADVGVAAAGTVSWEICALGLPSLLIPVAENQVAAATELRCRGAGRVLPQDSTTAQIALSIRELMLQAGERRRLSQTARSLVDGEGARRVVAALRS